MAIPRQSPKSATSAPRPEATPHFAPRTPTPLPAFHFPPSAFSSSFLQVPSSKLDPRRVFRSPLRAPSSLLPAIPSSSSAISNLSSFAREVRSILHRAATGAPRLPYLLTPIS
jgi:hypothetical protein